MANPVSCGNATLPITLDLEVNVTKQQVLNVVNLSTVVLVNSAGPLPSGAGRIRFYDTLDGVEEDWGSNSPAFRGAAAFFSQSPRPTTIAMAQAFTTPQPGFLTTAQSGSVAAFTAISDGTFTISIDGVAEDITALDFTSDLNFDDIATTIQVALQAIATGGYTDATVVATNTTLNQFIITSGTAGDGSTVSVLTTEGTGTDISGVGFLNGQSGAVVVGYTPTTFTNELILIQQAASCAGQFVYGWALDETYRDTSDQLEAATWAEGEQFVEMALLSNNPLSYDPNDIGNNIVEFFNAGYTRTTPFFHDDISQYPDVASLAVLLSVDYAGQDTTLTLKFKNLIGIDPVQFFNVSAETAVDVLESRRANIFVLIGNGARTVRQGTQASTVYFADDRTNTDNFVNDLLTNIYNVFLSTPKVPYTTAGISLLHAAEAQICNKYVRNGTLSSRQVNDPTSPNGIKIVPAFNIIFEPLQDVTVADRNARLLAGNQIILQYADAVHSMIINVTVVS